MILGFFSYLSPDFLKKNVPGDNLKEAVQILSRQTLNEIQLATFRYNWDKFPIESSFDARLKAFQYDFIPYGSYKTMGYSLHASLKIFNGFLKARHGHISSIGSMYVGQVFVKESVKFANLIISKSYSKPMVVFGVILICLVGGILYSMINSWAKHQNRMSSKFIRDLTSQTQNSNNPIFGRNEEISSIVRALSNSTPVLLVGPTGSGKTAIVQSLARSIACGGCKPLHGRRVFSINASDLLAENKGIQDDFESFFEEIEKNHKHSIVFIDEVHGANRAGVYVSSWHQKASLILATTDEEYEKHLKHDSTISDRVKIVFIPELGKEHITAFLMKKYSVKKSIAEQVVDFQLRNQKMSLLRGSIQILDELSAQIEEFQINPSLYKEKKDLEYCIAAAEEKLGLGNVDALVEAEKCAKSLEDIEQKIYLQEQKFNYLIEIRKRVKQMDLQKFYYVHDYFKRKNLASRSIVWRIHSVIIPAMEALYKAKKEEYKKEYALEVLDAPNSEMVLRAYQQMTENRAPGQVVPPLSAEIYKNELAEFQAGLFGGSDWKSYLDDLEFLK